MADTKDAIAWGMRFRRVLYDPGHVTSRRAWVPRVLAEYVKHVAKVKANSAHTQQRISFSKKRRSCLWLKKQVADHATSVEVQANASVEECRRGEEARYQRFSRTKHRLGLGE